MNITPLELDLPSTPNFAAADDELSGSGTFGALIDHAARGLERAQAAEREFAGGTGSLLAMTTSRATSDVDLSIAAAAASRVAQALSTFANMTL